MTNDDVRADVQATDPYPPSRVALDLDAEGRELMEEIMTTAKQKTPLRAHPLRRHGRWVVPVAAAAAVAAVVAGGVVLRGGDDGADPGPANPGQATSSKSAQQKPAQPKQPKSDPGLPPTPENLYHVVLNDDAWSIDNLNSGPEYGGSLSWESGSAETGFKKVEVTWYEAKDHQMYLNDRRDGGPGQPATVLGQEGESFRWDIPLPNSKHVKDYGNSMIDPPPGPSDDLRVMTILPPVGDWFLEFDVSVDDEQEYAAVMAALSRVNGDAWAASIDAATVATDEGPAFLDESLQGVPMPPGVTVTVADLSLPQSAYHARIEAIVKPLCGWAKRYLDGDQQALAKLQASSGWPAMQALASEGGYASVVAEDIQHIDDRTYQDLRQSWTCP